MKAPRESGSFADVPGNSGGMFLNLSSRQLQVAELAACGYSNREIALELKITEQIVKNSLHSVFDKVGIWNRVELANRFPRGPARPPGAGLNGSGQPLQCRTLDNRAAFNQLSKVPECGMELRDLLEDPEFPLRQRRPRQETCIGDAYRTLGRVFADDPGVILQHLVDAATTFCSADSAGISLEEGDKKGPRRFRWIAISGSFSSFLGGTTPRFFSPCGTTLDSGRVQLYRVGKNYYDFLGIKADPITDGILIPWQAGEVRGTLWVVSHRYREAFDVDDFKLIEGLADFAAIAVENGFRQGKLQKPAKNCRPQEVPNLKAG